MPTKYRFLAFVFLSALIIGPLYSSAQSKKTLEERKEALRREIDIANGLLKDTRDKKSISLGQLKTLSKKIGRRQELINTMSTELHGLEREIGSMLSEIDQLSDELVRLKKEYAAMLRFTFLHKDLDKQMTFIFASSDFNQAYKRLKYIQQYSDYRRNQALLITETQLKIAKQVEQLNYKKLNKQQLLKIEKTQKKELVSEKKQQETLVKQLQQDEKKLRKQLQAKQVEIAKVNRAIEVAIRKEIEASRKKKTTTKKGTTTTTTVEIEDTPENKLLTSNFEHNRGRLPWPVEKGVITGNFGTQAHPVLKGIVINNNGVDITTPMGSSARAVFEGQVLRVLDIPGNGKAIIIKHGSFFSVYSNIAESSVKPGDKISVKQSIGKVGVNDDKDKGEVHLEVWRGETRLNPVEWLSGR